MLPQNKIPKGWRLLRTGELRKVGDQFFQKGVWQLSCLEGFEVTQHDCVIRSMANDRPPSPFANRKVVTTQQILQPKKGFFNTFSLIPSRLFHRKTSKEKVKDYLERLKTQKAKNV